MSNLNQNEFENSTTVFGELLDKETLKLVVIPCIACIIFLIFWTFCNCWTQYLSNYTVVDTSDNLVLPGPKFSRPENSTRQRSMSAPLLPLLHP